jgi:hypothetical protein
MEWHSLAVFDMNAMVPNADPLAFVIYIHDDLVDARDVASRLRSFLQFGIVP